MARFNHQIKLTLEQIRETCGYALATMHGYLAFSPTYEPSGGETKEKALGIHFVGDAAYGYFVDNENLDVNVPPSKRYDLYKLVSGRLPELCGSVFEPEKEGDKVRTYTYDSIRISDGKLVALGKHKNIEEAKRALMLYVVATNARKGE